MTYVLHYAPDNASVIVRLVLETAGVPYDARLVDRHAGGQSNPDYRQLNPQGQIPALETPTGVLHETGAILAWLSEQHGGLAPMPGSDLRGRFLTWLLVLSNSLHPAMRQSFYPDKFIREGLETDLRDGMKRELARVLHILEGEVAKGDLFTQCPVLDFYLGACLRWAQIYPAHAPTLSDLSEYPAIAELLRDLDTRPATQIAITAEGLGAKPFSAPCLPNPPEGSAL